jgi:hypothetical protein
VGKGGRVLWKGTQSGAPMRRCRGETRLQPHRSNYSSATTASDGTFHDVPFGLCSDGPFSNLTQLQIIYINSTSQKVGQNPVTYNSSGSGHGTMSNGNDISAMR